MTPKGYISGHPVYVRRPDDVAGLIKSGREVRGLSQHALAERLGVSRKWVNEMEQGNATAGLGLVLRALNELGIELYGQVAPEGADRQRPSVHHQTDDIDIDAIANTGLNTGLPVKRGPRR